MRFGKLIAFGMYLASVPFGVAGYNCARDYITKEDDYINRILNKPAREVASTFAGISIFFGFVMAGSSVLYCSERERRD